MKTLLSAGIGVVAGGALLSTSATDAEAAFALRLTATGGAPNTVTVIDGVGADALDGAVGFIGSLGNFSMNFTGGVSSPLLATPTPHIDLATLNVSGTSAGELVIELSQTGNSNTGQHFNLTWTPSVNGTSRLEAFTDLNDGLFGNTDTSAAATKLFDVSAVGPGGSAFNLGADGPTDDAYSVTLRWTVTHTSGGQSTSGNAKVQIPEPGTLGLFGFGLLGMGLLWRRRSRLTPAA